MHGLYESIVSNFPFKKPRRKILNSEFIFVRRTVKTKEIQQKGRKMQQKCLFFKTFFHDKMPQFLSANRFPQCVSVFAHLQKKTLKNGYFWP